MTKRFKGYLAVFLMLVGLTDILEGIFGKNIIWFVISFAGLFVLYNDEYF